MVKASGLVFIALILGSALLGVDLITNSDFLQFFAKELSINIMLTLLALSIATVTFLLGHIIPLEQKSGMRFTNTRNELKQNIYFMTIVTGLNFLAVSAAGPNSFDVGTVSGPTFFSYISAVLSIMLVISMMEIVGLIFHVDGSDKS